MNRPLVLGEKNYIFEILCSFRREKFKIIWLFRENVVLLR